MPIQPKIHIFFGPMYAGKTTAMKEALFRHQFAENDYFLFKPAKDDRFSVDNVVTHAENSSASDGHKAIVLNSSNDVYTHIPKYPCALGFDEVNFFDEGIVPVVSSLFDKGHAIYLATLNLDFQRQSFRLGDGSRSIGDLLAMATNSTELTSVCENRLSNKKPCGNDARYTHSLLEMDSHVKVGGKEAYISVCDGCYRSLNNLDSK